MGIRVILSAAKDRRSIYPERRSFAALRMTVSCQLRCGLFHRDDQIIDRARLLGEEQGSATRGRREAGHARVLEVKERRLEPAISDRVKTPGGYALGGAALG